LKSHLNHVQSLAATAVWNDDDDEIKAAANQEIQDLKKNVDDNLKAEAAKVDADNKEKVRLSKQNKYDGLIHDGEGKRTFSDDGCVVGGVNDSYKHTGHPWNKTQEENFT
jgi:hypothetical protein